MPDFTKTLRDRCHVNTNKNDDRFVGMKVDIDDMKIYFPIGYQLPDDDDELRTDIQNLLGVLATFMKEDKVFEESGFDDSEIVEFPMHAYLKIIEHFLWTGNYYVENEQCYKTDTKGKTSWPRTVKEQKALVQKNGSLVFTNMTVRSVITNTDKQITQIHRYCVYEAFDKLGVVYVSYMPESPRIYPNIKEAIYILTKKLASTNNDTEQELFTAMKDMLLYQDKKGIENGYFFGTDSFESIWERMVDRAFGIENKEQFFPRTRWFLNYGRNKEKRPLYPDSIMVYDDKYYVLDAKYYRYGQTGNPDHLPNGTDINKQITYGEYIEKTRGIPNEKLFNAFIMPYNKHNNFFGLMDDIGNIGEAVGDWRFDSCNPQMKNYERIQGIVIDTRYLMYNYNSFSEQIKYELAIHIEKVLSRGIVSAPRIL